MFKITYQFVSERFVEKIFVIVHPYFGESNFIDLRPISFHANVMETGSLNMSYMRTRNNLQCSTTHPYLEKDNTDFFLPLEPPESLLEDG